MVDNKKDKKSLLTKFNESAVWKSIFRSGVPRTRRQRMYAILGNVFLHLQMVCFGSLAMANNA